MELLIENLRLLIRSAPRPINTSECNCQLTPKHSQKPSLKIGWTGKRQEKGIRPRRLKISIKARWTQVILQFNLGSRFKKEKEKKKGLIQE